MPTSVVAAHGADRAAGRDKRNPLKNLKLIQSKLFFVGVIPPVPDAPVFTASDL